MSRNKVFVTFISIIVFAFSLVVMALLDANWESISGDHLYVYWIAKVICLLAIVGFIGYFMKFGNTGAAYLIGIITGFLQFLPLVLRILLNDNIFEWSVITLFVVIIFYAILVFSLDTFRIKELKRKEG